MTTPPRIVVFDWGGVILRICRSWQEGCERAGLPVREGSENPAAIHARRAISHDYQVGFMDCRTFVERLSHTTNGLYSPEEMLAIHDAWLIEEYQGIDAVISELVATASVTTGMLSNTNHLHWSQQLRPNEGGTHRFATARRLEHRHASHLLGAAKPDQRIFSLFEQETGFRGDDILFFDDLNENIESARRLGWCAEQIDHTGDTANQIDEHLRTHCVW